MRAKLEETIEQTEQRVFSLMEEKFGPRYQTGHIPANYPGQEVDVWGCRPWIEISRLRLTEEFMEKYYAKLDWKLLSWYQDLSEEIMRKYANLLNWHDISTRQKMSFDFMREFQYKIDWYSISTHGNPHTPLDDKAIREFSNRLNYQELARSQKLTESIMRELEPYLNWDYISKFQELPENMLRDFYHKLDWGDVFKYQVLPEQFLLEIIPKITHLHHLSYIVNLQKYYESVEKALGKKQKELGVDEDNYFSYVKKYRENHEETKIEAMGGSDDQKKKEIAEYAIRYNLEFDGTYLYAYREHDVCGRGAFNRTIFYDEIGKEYRDWHCDVDPENCNSHGLGIWPKYNNVNTRVRVHYKDWGCEVNDLDNMGKGRVWAFTLLGPIEDQPE